jgi:hypothetical protein
MVKLQSLRVETAVRAKRAENRAAAAADDTAAVQHSMSVLRDQTITVSWGPNHEGCDKYRQHVRPSPATWSVSLNVAAERERARARHAAVRHGCAPAAQSPPAEQASPAAQQPGAGAAARRPAAQQLVRRRCGRAAAVVRRLTHARRRRSALRPGAPLLRCALL